jgi:hypothetical protein
VHRDIAPSNILIDLSGRVKLLDFGIARMKMENSSTCNTTNEKFKGRLAYAAPENLSTQEVTELTDIYACGVVLHELLVGQNEFFSHSIGATISRVMNHKLGPVLSVRADAPLEIDEIITRATAKNMVNRYKNAAEFAEDLRSARQSDESASIDCLRRAVKEDFNSEMAESLGVASLEELDRAWREPVVSSPALFVSSMSEKPQNKPKSFQEAETQVYHNETELIEHMGSPTSTANIDASAPKQREHAVLVPTKYLIAIILLLAAAIGVGAILVLNKKAAPLAEPSGFLLVQSPVDEAANQQRDSAIVDIDGDSTMAGYTETFRKKNDELYRCFTSHDFNIEDTPELSVLFRVGVTGTVSSAELFPRELSTTQAGQCILSLAKAMVFSPRGEPVSFMIPLIASRTE